MIKCQIFIFLYLLIYSSIIIIRKNDDKMKKKLLPQFGIRNSL